MDEWEASSPNTANTTIVGYDADGNGVQSTFGYDALNRVTGLSASTGSYQYQRGAAGNLTSGRVALVPMIRFQSHRGCHRSLALGDR